MSTIVPSLVYFFFFFPRLIFSRAGICPLADKLWTPHHPRYGLEIRIFLFPSFRSAFPRFTFDFFCLSSSSRFFRPPRCLILLARRSLVIYTFVPFNNFERVVGPSSYRWLRANGFREVSGFCCFLFFGRTIRFHSEFVLFPVDQFLPLHRFGPFLPGHLNEGYWFHLIAF